MLGAIEVFDKKDEDKYSIELRDSSENTIDIYEKAEVLKVVYNNELGYTKSKDNIVHEKRSIVREYENFLTIIQLHKMELHTNYNYYFNGKRR